MRAWISTMALLVPAILVVGFGCTAGSVSGPTDDAGTSTGSPSSTTSGTSTAPTGTAADDGGSRTIYCGSVDDTECACSTTQEDNLTASGTCNASSVGSPSLCCAIAGWPSSSVDDQGFGGCFCSQVFCETDGDVCQCGFAAPSTGDTAVSSCAPTSGEICCRSKSDDAPTCACYQGTACAFDGDEVVPSCDPTTLACADETVTSCH